MLVPEDIEEERRLCYVGMTRAMDQLILTRAVYRRRYGTDLPEASVPSRFLEEVPAPLLEELGTRRSSTARVGIGRFCASGGRSSGSLYREHALLLRRRRSEHSLARHGETAAGADASPKPTAPARPYNSIENIAEFFASRGKKFSVPKTAR